MSIEELKIKLAEIYDEFKKQQNKLSYQGSISRSSNGDSKDLFESEESEKELSAVQRKIENLCKVWEEDDSQREENYKKILADLEKEKEEISGLRTENFDLKFRINGKEDQLKKIDLINGDLRRLNEKLCHDIKELEQKLEKSNSNNSNKLIVADHLVTIKDHHVRMTILWFVLIAISVLITLYKLLKYVYSKGTQLFWKPKI